MFHFNDALLKNETKIDLISSGWKMREKDGSLNSLLKLKTLNYGYKIEMVIMDPLNNPLTRHYYAARR